MFSATYFGLFCTHSSGEKMLLHTHDDRTGNNTHIRCIYDSRPDAEAALERIVKSGRGKGVYIAEVAVTSA